ncbi:hypothetical protein JYB64_02050 [Algoriphagus aestuarii]|nr:hypothetical protein [Algoriphagus aestuarii]
MKKYIASFLLIGLIFSCSPSEQKVDKLTNLLAEWKTTSEMIGDLSNELGDQMYLLESKKEDSNGSEAIPISVNGEASNCETEYAALKEKVDELIVVWQKNSKEVEDLTQRMSSGKWTAEDDGNLDGLATEAKKAKANVDLWIIKLNELKTKCELQSETSNS